MGIVGFGLLYGVAACQYPGGSSFDHMAVGFSWQHNYWCDLLGVTGKNGAYNPARPIALTAMALLCSSLAVFWYLLPVLYGTQTHFIRISQWAGILAMAIVLFIGSPYHDLVMNVAGSFGGVALMATVLCLYRNRLFGLIVVGGVCLVLIGVNNYVYYTLHYLVFLPIIQKGTFVLFLSWISLVNWKLYKRQQLTRD